VTLICSAQAIRISGFRRVASALNSNDDCYDDEDNENEENMSHA
jgi:hypothetical protein